MQHLRQYLKTGTAVCIAVTLIQCAHAQPSKDAPVPGAVVLKNGMILRGLCSSTNTIDPLLQTRNQGLELRTIDQRFRIYAVSTRQSNPVVIDNQAVPNQEFRIPQRRVSKRPLNYAIGLHNQSPFDANGKARVELRLAGAGTAEIEVGITAVNSMFAAVDGLTHNWEFAIATAQIPDATLYAGPNEPSLLRSSPDFVDGEQRLNMVKMLLEAEKYSAAKLLITDIAVDFPELEARCNGLSESWNDAVGQRVLDELAMFREAGKHDTARRYARSWPDDQLAPAIRVRAATFAEQLDEDGQRVNNIIDSINDQIANIEDETIRREAMQLAIEIKRELNIDTLGRFAPFELFALDDGLSAESKIAMATTGWLLGADNAFDSFPAAVGLLQIRYTVSDFLQTKDENIDERNRLLDRIRSLEGFSVERVAQVIRLLPPSSPLSAAKKELAPQEFEIEATEFAAGCLGQLPAEYSNTRQYPLVVAFPRGGAKSVDTLQWWSRQADRYGFVLAVPELYASTDGNYDATADQHTRLIALIRKLKNSINIDDDRVFIAGHDIGGEAAMDIGTAHPDLFAGIVSIGGLGRRHIQWTAHNSMTLSWYVVVGTRQPFYYTRMELLMRKLLQRAAASREHSDVIFVRYPERGFESYPEELPNLFRWMTLQRRTAFPDQIDATVVRSTDTDWSWLGLETIPSRFASLDAAGTPETRPLTHAKVSASISRNLIRITSIPSDGFVRISPSLPEIDINEPIVIRVGSNLKKVTFEPSIRDLLNDFRIYRDRSRLCFMKVPIQK